MTSLVNNNLINNLLKPRASEKELGVSKINEISVKTLYTLGLIFAMVSLNFFLSPVFIMDAAALSVGISILSFKSAYDIHKNGEITFPKITLNTGVFQIGLT